MLVHEAVAAALADLGVDTMFGLIGDSNLFMVDRFVRQHQGRYFSAVHEAGAVMMAHGYAVRSGRLGVATVTQGPGLTNTATALVEATRSGTPMVLITGDTAPEQHPQPAVPGSGAVRSGQPAPITSWYRPGRSGASFAKRRGWRSANGGR